MSNTQPKVKVLVLRAAGTNCDKETVFAFEQAGAKVDMVHLNQLRESPKTLNEYQILVLPGGFSFGDDISAGKIFSVRLRHELGQQIGEFVQSDKLVLGICNGFQILVKTGLLPDAKITGEYSQTVTLSDNDSGKFEDRWVWLKSYSKKCVFIESGETIYIPSAHGEGKFIPHDDEVLARLKANDQIVFRYVDEKGDEWTSGWRIHFCRPFFRTSNSESSYASQNLLPKASSGTTGKYIHARPTESSLKYLTI